MLIRSIQRRLTVVAVAGPLALSAAPTLGADNVGASLVGLGDLPGGPFHSAARDVSADGATVIGTSTSAFGSEAFKHVDGTMIPLGDLPGGIFRSIGYGLSGDGSVAVGWSAASGVTMPFKHVNGTLIGLPEFTTGPFVPGFENIATSVSADGSVIVGYGASSKGLEAFMYVGDTAIGLGGLPGATTFQSMAHAVSADGTTVVGASNSSTGNQAFKYANGVMTGLGDLPGGASNSQAVDVSANGSVVVGRSSAAVGTLAFRHANGVMTSLGDLAGGTVESLADGVSADGSIVIGVSQTSNHGQLFIWDRYSGMRSLQTMLTATPASGGYGLDLSGWGTLFRGFGPSADGRTIVGGSPHGADDEAWKIVLPDAAALTTIAPSNTPAALNAVEAGAVAFDRAQPLMVHPVETDGWAGTVNFSGFQPGEFVHLLLDFELEQGTLVNDINGTGYDNSFHTLQELIDYFVIGNAYKDFTVVTHDPRLSANPDFELMLVWPEAGTGGLQHFSWDLFNMKDVSLDRVAFAIPEPASTSTIGIVAATILLRRRRQRDG